jgi:hypothetical protein
MATVLNRCNGTQVRKIGYDLAHPQSVPFLHGNGISSRSGRADQPMGPLLMAARLLLTVTEAAEALGVSDRHIKRLIQEADANRKSRWRWGRELIDLAPVGSSRRTVRVNVAAVAPGAGQPSATP